jgi:tRNA(Ile)-lysidine synthase
LAAPEELALRALSAVARTIGGGDPPRLVRLERLLADLAGKPVRRSFAGCLFIPRKGRWLICREQTALAPALPAEAGDELRWDGRFRIRLAGPGAGSVGPLGPDGLAAVRAAGVESDLPATVAYSFPALRSQSVLCAVPGLGYKAGSGFAVMSIEPAPARPLAGWPGGLVPQIDGIISSGTASTDMCAGNVHSVGAG